MRWETATAGEFADPWNSTDPPASPILTEPLAIAAGGTSHSVKVFDSTSDPDYQAILAWITAGVPR